jgi:solute:Na+ symporter, SSS family
VNLLDYLVMLIYFAVIIGAGYWGLRRARSAEDYLVAGRRLGSFMYIGWLAAVVLGGASTIGGIALGYENGVSGMWLVFWIGMGVIALGLLMSLPGSHVLASTPSPRCSRTAMGVLRA